MRILRPCQFTALLKVPGEHGPVVFLTETGCLEVTLERDDLLRCEAENTTGDDDPDEMLLHE